jgi:hypothetical protein
MNQSANRLVGQRARSLFFGGGHNGAAHRLKSSSLGSRYKINRRNRKKAIEHNLPEGNLKPAFARPIISPFNTLLIRPIPTRRCLRLRPFRFRARIQRWM